MKCAEFTRYKICVNPYVDRDMPMQLPLWPVSGSQ